MWARDPAESFPLPLPCLISRNHHFIVVSSGRKPELSNPHTVCRSEFLLRAASIPSEDSLPMTSAKLLLLLLEVEDD